VPREHLVIALADLDSPSASPEPIGHEAARRANPGILVFTTCLQLLYINEEARAFCGRLNKKRAGKAMNGVVPVEIIKMCEAVSRNFSSRRNVKDWEHFQLRQLAGSQESLVLLRGLGLPDRGGLTKSRVLILMEDVAHRQAIIAKSVDGRFRLTTRERTAVIYLLQGLTNKEIACRMMICEQTVKEHIKHIMEKTKTTTRTGILSKILLSEHDQEPNRPSKPTLPS
jgi:DNA-binding CsgD family transcriptional regulator